MSSTAQPAAVGVPEAAGEWRGELVKEAATMAPYVAICLLAALSSGASTVRSTLYGGGVMVVALAVVLAKNVLSGH